MDFHIKKNWANRFVEWVTKNAKTSFLLCLIFFAFMVPGLQYFGEQYDVKIWFRETDSLLQNLNRFERQFGNDEKLIVAFKNPKGIFNEESLAYIEKMTESLWRLKDVVRVDSLSNFQQGEGVDDEIIIEPFLPEDWQKRPNLSQFLKDKKAQALSHKVLPDYLVSKDGKSVLFFCYLSKPENGGPPYSQIMANVEALFANNPPQNGEYYFLGDAQINHSFKKTAIDDMSFILPILLLLIVVYLAVLFRSLVAVFIPLFVIGTSLIGTMGAVFYLGYKFNNMMSILPAIIIATGIADSVHILMSFYQFLGEGKEQKDAVYSALKKNLIPTLLTTISTVIGFFSLTFTELMPIRSLGIAGAIGCFFAWLVTVFMVIPILLWVKIKVPGHFVNGQEKDIGRARKMTLLIARFRRSILCGSIILSMIALILACQVEVNSDPMKYFSMKMPIRIAHQVVESEFGGSSGPEIVIEAGGEDKIKEPSFLKNVEALKYWLEEKPFVNRSIDIVDTIKQMNKTLNGGDERFYLIPETKNMVAEELFLFSMGLPQGMDLNNRMTIKNDAIRMSIIWHIYDSQTWLKEVQVIEKKAEELNLKIWITGKFHLFQRMINYVVMTFFSSVSMAMGLVAILMMFVFRSFKLGLISLIPNVLPLIFGGALMYLLGIDLNIGSALVASVCLGIAIDDTIHFLSHFQKMQLKGKGIMENIEHTFRYTGSALIVTTMVLASGFGLYMLGNFVPNIHFGILCAIILTMALIIDLIFLPALLMTIFKEKEKF